MLFKQDGPDGGQKFLVAVLDQHEPPGFVRFADQRESLLSQLGVPLASACRAAPASGSRFPARQRALLGATICSPADATQPFFQEIAVKVHEHMPALTARYAQRRS